MNDPGKMLVFLGLMIAGVGLLISVILSFLLWMFRK